MRQCNCYSPRREVYERIQQMIDATLAGSDLATDGDLAGLENDLQEGIDSALRIARDAERRADDAYSLAEDAEQG